MSLRRNSYQSVVCKCFLYPEGISHEICEIEGKYKNKEAY